MRPPKTRNDDHAAYRVPEKTPAQARAELRCVACDGVVEPWAAPLDPRVQALCDACQRANQTTIGRG